MEESESKLCLCDSKAWALSKNLREINSSLFSSQINSEIKEFNCGRWEGMAEGRGRGVDNLALRSIGYNSGYLNFYAMDACYSY